MNKRKPEHQPATCRIVGVLGGDEACVRSVLRVWTRRPVRTLPNKEITLVSGQNRRLGLAVLGQRAPTFDSWPGGPLIWVWPERGPSEPELAHLRELLIANQSSHPALRVLLCMPADAPSEEVVRDLETVARTLQWGLEAASEIDLEAVWVGRSDAGSLQAWLQRLGDNA